MTRGILVGCDHHQEWMLPWWWSHYTRHNYYPVAFVDLGMTPSAKKWCQSRGHLILLDTPKDFVFPKSLLPSDVIGEWEKVHGKELWKERNQGFHKPFALQQTSFDETIWIDLDCEITGALAPLFHKIHVHSKMALALENGPSDETEYNTGVIVYHKSSPLLSLWTDLCFRHNDRFLSDQDALTYLIHSEHIEVTELPSKYNWVVREGINFEAIILHWAGTWGKEVIRRQCCESK